MSGLCLELVGSAVRSACHAAWHFVSCCIQAIFAVIVAEHAGHGYRAKHLQWEEAQPNGMVCLSAGQSAPRSRPRGKRRSRGKGACSSPMRRGRWSQQKPTLRSWHDRTQIGDSERQCCVELCAP